VYPKITQENNAQKKINNTDINLVFHLLFKKAIKLLLKALIKGRSSIRNAIIFINIFFTQKIVMYI
jgi:hypothetical protein